MGTFLICSSLRERPDWASLTPALLRSTTPKWREMKLDTHDMALPLPGGLGGGGSSRRMLRVVLLSPHEVGSVECRGRIQRLYHLDGGRDVAIVLLLKQVADRAESPTAALMRLQLELVGGGSEMPIIPAHSVQDLPASLIAFHRQISIGGLPRKTANPAQALLPFASQQRLSEHAVNVLTDITSDLRGLVEKTTTIGGQAEIVEYLGEDAEAIISFWKEEYLVL
ncbi:hypothetical protein F4778DRAFT_229441 [Xylariomycetidae sp. FL2044]|nr:hypothetical protein F4778DRAFT_229441 [Xylariomycetidae sp. FL2044]